MLWVRVPVFVLAVRGRGCRGRKKGGFIEQRVITGTLYDWMAFEQWSYGK